MAADPPSGAPAEPLYARVAAVRRRWGPGGTVGLVVGATAPAELAAIRAIAPGLAFLVPGVGAQGGDVEAGAGRRTGDRGARRWRPAAGSLVNVSRGIAGAAVADGRRTNGPGDLGERLAEAAARMGRTSSLCYPSRAGRPRGFVPSRGPILTRSLPTGAPRCCRTSEPPSSSSSW